MFAPAAHVFFNMCLIKKVYFGCGVLMLTPKQEEMLMKIHEPVTLRKMGFSVKFPRKIVHAQKAVLGIGINETINNNGNFIIEITCRS